jgi:hypothetical protein
MPEYYRFGQLQTPFQVPQGIYGISAPSPESRVVPFARAADDSATDLRRARIEPHPRWRMAQQ